MFNKNPRDDPQARHLAILYQCIVDNALQTVPPQLAKLGDRITLTDGCFLEVMTSVDEQAVHGPRPRAAAAQDGRGERRADGLRRGRDGLRRSSATRSAMNALGCTSTK